MQDRLKKTWFPWALALELRPRRADSTPELQACIVCAQTRRQRDRYRESSKRPVQHVFINIFSMDCIDIKYLTTHNRAFGLFPRGLGRNFPAGAANSSENKYIGRSINSQYIVKQLEQSDNISDSDNIHGLALSLESMRRRPGKQSTLSVISVR
ncbi:Hypothetical_protein [Hexamita inflata]|uniref:Hypothetical_protein n=1 Tax=Hexamita inflata TaxID=28002 RepID=A0AA86QSE0_9EUKA|nr:Hypothetical protein HINF_LOCUS50818 [Hexamita inflata]